MDLHVQGNPRLHYRLNGYQQSNDDGLQFLSVEEKECILFFEKTLKSLEEGFDDTTGMTSRRITPAEGLRTSSNSALNPALASNASPSLMEHDIIDLVHSPSNFTVPDFQNLSETPEPYYETIPNKDSVIPSSSSDAYEDNYHSPPPGSVPTPVVIASKISEHQGTGGITPSALLGRRYSLESKRDRPMPARIHKLPSNISMTRGNRETSHQSLATEAVNAQERRSQMLANLPASSHPLEGGEPSCMRKLPLHSVSFKDMTPEKSRMEALSKLRLVGDNKPNLTASIVSKGSSSTSPNSSAYKVSSSASSPVSSPNKVSSGGISASNNANKVNVNTQAHMSNNINISNNIVRRKNSNTDVAQSTPSSGYEPKPKNEVSSKNFNYYGGKSAAFMPITKDTTAPVNQERRASIPPSSAEVKQTDFNSYGGKTVVLNPVVKAESIPSAPANTPELEAQFNSFGGRSKVINPSVNSDGVNCTHSHSPTNTVTPTMHHDDPTKYPRYPSEQNTYDAKPKALTPLKSDPVNQPIVRTRPATLPPPTAPRPQCPTGSLRPRPEPVPPEILNKPVPSIRNQGVTVQFSGKGTTGEARRDALRRLGLLNNPS